MEVKNAIEYSRVSTRTESLIIELMMEARGKSNHEAQLLGAQAVGAYTLWRELTVEVRGKKEDGRMKSLLRELDTKVKAAKKGEAG